MVMHFDINQSTVLLEWQNSCKIHSFIVIPNHYKWNETKPKKQHVPTSSNLQSYLPWWTSQQKILLNQVSVLQEVLTFLILSLIFYSPCFHMHWLPVDWVTERQSLECCLLVAVFLTWYSISVYARHLWMWLGSFRKDAQRRRGGAPGSPEESRREGSWGSRWKYPSHLIIDLHLVY